MTFLGKIRDMFGGGDQPDASPEPLRNRTFSAAQFREDELARSAEARARAEAVQIDAAQVLSPAVNPIAENLMSAESAILESDDAEPLGADETEFAESEDAQLPESDEVNLPDSDDTPLPVSDEVELPDADEAELAAPATEPAAVTAAVPVGDPMPWDEAVGWLSQRSAETRNFVGQYWNWDHDLRVLHFLAQQPDLDAGVAAHIFWITAASEDNFPFGDDEPEGDVAGHVAWLTHFIGRRFAEGAFRPASYGFDDSWDCERLKQHLTSLHEEGRLEWSPEAIPTSSQAEMMSFDDLPEEEREEVGEFLARFGVC